jgi:hypothetical protein
VDIVACGAGTSSFKFARCNYARSELVPNVAEDDFGLPFVGCAAEYSLNDPGLKWRPPVFLGIEAFGLAPLGCRLNIDKLLKQMLIWLVALTGFWMPVAVLTANASQAAESATQHREVPIAMVAEPSIRVASEDWISAQRLGEK